MLVPQYRSMENGGRRESFLQDSMSGKEARQLGNGAEAGGGGTLSRGIVR
jgi:hypothetical protein